VSPDPAVRGSQGYLNETTPDGQATLGEVGLTRRTVVAAGYASAARIGAQAIQFGVTVALARLLTPRDFGLVAVVAVFIGFATQFTDLGIGAALIRQRPLADEHLTSAFWLNALSGVLVCLALVGLSPLVAAAYSQPRLRTLMAVMALTPALSLGVVHLAILERTLQFRRVAAVEIAATALGGSVAIGLAAGAHAGPYSIVAMTLTTATASSLLYWLVVPWRPTFSWSREALREVWRFGSRIMGFTIVNYWARNADNLVVAKISGPNALGLYSRAYSLMLMPMNQVTWVAGRVMYPALSEVADDRERARNAYLRAVRAVAVVGFPIFGGMAVSAHALVLSLFGSNWDGMIAIVRILALAGLIQVVGSSVGWIYQSQGRADLLLKWGLIATPIFIGAFIVGAAWGARGVATAYVIANLVMLYPSLRLSGQLISLRATQVLAALRMTLLATAVMALAVWSVEQITFGSAYSMLAVQIATGAVVYLAAMRVLEPTTVRELQSAIRSLRSK
jgi:PST family polysaccharide transporter